jgi:DNA invertase Pin-like site-specific DNA recombinase
LHLAHGKNAAPKACADITPSSRRKGGNPRIDAAQVRKLRADGLFIRDIMARLSVSKASVYRALRSASP